MKKLFFLEVFIVFLLTLIGTNSYCSSLPISELESLNSTLPIRSEVTVNRQDEGRPLSASELTAATEDLISIIRSTNYFNTLDSRVQGWPESDTRFPWWGNYWVQGVSVLKHNGKVSFIHNASSNHNISSNHSTLYNHEAVDSDHLGIYNAPLMEGACYAYLLWGNDSHVHLMQKIVRAMGYWIFSSSTNLQDKKPILLNQSFFPISVNGIYSGQEIFLNYNAVRANLNSNFSEYVHLPQNPFFGDIYVKNNPSKEDIGPIIRSLTLVKEACGTMMKRNPSTKDQRVANDIALTVAAYARWGEYVDENGFIIPSLAHNGSVNKSDTINNKYYRNTNDFIQSLDFNITVKKTINGKGGETSNSVRKDSYPKVISDVDCDGVYAIHMLNSSTSGNDINCQKGNTIPDELESFLEKNNLLKNEDLELWRSNHEAAAVIAQSQNQTAQALLFLVGLGDRVKKDFKKSQSSTFPETMQMDDIPMLLISSANAGVSLTSNEIRWLHHKIHVSAVAYQSIGQSRDFHLFEPQVPDGTYAYNLQNTKGGIYFRGIGMLLGACASPYRNTKRPILDCERLRNAFNY